ncbi:MAG: RNA polymerase sigma factor [Acidobacteriota bacterium]|nr:RNA polymerase sigma factor [Acidobacteriota bacterium]
MSEAADRLAFTALYREHHTRVFRFAIHMTADRMKATEVTQDVFVWLIHHPGAFDPARGEMGAFLIGVARKFLQKLRRTELKLVPFKESPTRYGERPERADTSESEAGELRKAIATLPDRYREAVVLCDLEGMSYEGAAVALECAVGTIRSRLHRARGLLARKLRTQQGCEA